MKVASRTLRIAVAMLALALPARADPIHLTSGALNWVSGGGAASVTMAGNGFTFSGAASPFIGIFGPLDCVLPECTAGGSVDLYSRFVGADLPGTVTYDGQTYTAVGSLNSSSSLAADWYGSLFVPAGFDGGVLTAPFTFAGAFYFQDTPTSGGRLDLFGGGLATLTFTPYPNWPGALALTSARYEFGADPVPEPATMVLIGTGLAGLAALRRRRRRGQRTDG
ncbi:hypothetical protein BH24ACI5_BH24ACI5_01810 [soil metagenome]